MRSNYPAAAAPERARQDCSGSNLVGVRLVRDQLLKVRHTGTLSQLRANRAAEDFKFTQGPRIESELPSQEIDTRSSTVPGLLQRRSWWSVDKIIRSIKQRGIAWLSTLGELGQISQGPKAAGHYLPAPVPLSTCRLSPLADRLSSTLRERSPFARVFIYLLQSAACCLLLVRSELGESPTCPWFRLSLAQPVENGSRNPTTTVEIPHKLPVSGRLKRAIVEDRPRLDSLTLGGGGGGCDSRQGHTASPVATTTTSSSTTTATTTITITTAPTTTSSKRPRLIFLTPVSLFPDSSARLSLACDRDKRMTPGQPPAT